MDKSLTNTYSYTVLPEDLDGRRHFRAVALERMLLNVAYNAANDRGFGALKLIDSGSVSWVLLKFAAEMTSMPAEEETVCIETWVESVNRMLTTRNFTIRNASGETIGCATTQWTIINLATRRPVNIMADTSIVNVVNPEPVDATLPGKLPEVHAEASRCLTVSYSDIDYNGHTNSMQYLQWMLDSCPVEILYGKQTARLEITYMKEVLYGEQVSIHFEEMEDGSALFAVRGTQGDFTRARIVWK
jgi:acyl-ACP thioesterase